MQPQTYWFRAVCVFIQNSILFSLEIT
uniref:Uncharacterized protein n=1 Tax=Anguilla anguilla TaxID=7936 RepID=A0A0E9SWH2_ANGAN